jgi:hypothetical protein
MRRPKSDGIGVQMFSCMGRDLINWAVGKSSGTCDCTHPSMVLIVVVVVVRVIRTGGCVAGWNRIGPLGAGVWSCSALCSSTRLPGYTHVAIVPLQSGSLKVGGLSR